VVEVVAHDSDRLSTFRTRHRFRHYGEFTSAEEYRAYVAWAAERNIPLFILGNGSNTLFTRHEVRALVLRNKIAETITPLGGDLFRVSSATQVMRVLKYCEKQGRDSFYFLASVPATVGGALAMNAGAGAGKTIFDFLVSLTYVDGAETVTLEREAITLAHRQTMFTGIQDKLILEAVFAFPEIDMPESEIRKRAHWARDHQDLAYPNCGSVFRVYHRPIVTRMRALPPWGISIPGFRAQYSRRVNNWIINRNPSARPIVILIRTVQLLHRLVGKRAIPEIIEVS
jgi:UDP-N-acetylmuramate dehydrogenase